MKKNFAFRLLSAIVATLLAGAAMAQNPSDAETSEELDSYKVKVVVTATRGEIPAREVAGSIDVITAEQIEQMQQHTVLEVLRTSPALDVVRSGGPGRQTSIFMRGAKPEHTLVLIDGVSVGDPMSTAGAYDFGYLSTDNVERIEIMRGPQSVLYGSNAIGGVINIITRKGSGRPNGYFSLEGGSYETFNESGGVNGGNEWINYSLAFSRQDSDGFSEASEKYGATEADGYGNTSISGRLGVTPSERANITTTFRRTDAKADMDGSSDDPNNIMEVQQHFFRVEGKFDLVKNLWNTNVGFSLGDTARMYRNDVDPAHPNSSDLSHYAGRTYQFDWQNDFRLHQTNALTFGIDTKEEKGSSDYYSNSQWGESTTIFPEESTRTTGYYLQDQIKLWNAWFTTVGVRLEDHSKFGTKSTYQIASAYVIDRTGTKLKMSFGTGFKAPSLYQLYSQYGYEDLSAEESTGWDVGFEQAVVRGRLTAGASYFDNDLDNMIDFDMATYSYANIARARTRGLELFATAQAAEGLTIRGNYTFTDTEDLNTGLELTRRARHKFGLNANYAFMENAELNFDLRYAGKRPDSDFATYQRTFLDDYVTVNLGGSYKLSRQVKLFARVENLFDSDYEEVSGYGSPGISAYGGVRVSF